MVNPDELGVVIAGASVAVTAAGVLIAGLVSVVIAVAQNRAARNTWRRDQLAARYIALREALSALTAHVALTASEAYQNRVPHDVSKELITTHDKLHGAIVRETEQVAVVSGPGLIRALRDFTVPRGELYPYGMGTATAAQLDDRDRARKLLADGAAILVLAMRLDLRTDGWRRRRRTREVMHQFSETVKAWESRNDNLTRTEMVQFLHDRRVLDFQGNRPSTDDPDAYLTIVIGAPELHATIQVDGHTPAQAGINRTLDDAAQERAMRWLVSSAAENFAGSGRSVRTPDGARRLLLYDAPAAQ